MNQVPTKVVGRRLVGFIVDSIILWVIGAVLFAVLAKKDAPIPSGNNVHVKVGDEQWVLVGSSYTVWVLLILVALLGIAVVLEGITGWTPGKLALGVRVVDKEGHTPGMGRAFLRLLGWIVDGVPWIFLWGLTGLITSASTKGNRRVGDMFGGTYVVKKEAIGVPVVVDGAPLGTVPAYPGPPAPGVVVTTPAPGRDAFGNPVPLGHEGGVPVAPGYSAPVRSGPASTAPATPPAVVQPATPVPAPGAPAADWYADPSGKKRLRYWDGSAWTDHTAD